jgi:hypothetical protein
MSAYLGLHHPQAFDEIANGFIPLYDVPNARHQCNRVLIASDFVQSLIGFSIKLDCKEAEDNVTICSPSSCGQAESSDAACSIHVDGNAGPRP